MKKDFKEWRTSLKATPVNDIVKNDEELSSKLGFSKDEKKTYPEITKLRAGANYFRIAPPHNPEDSTGKPNAFFEPHVLCFIPAMVAQKTADKKS
jgi:hypothetical protein